MACALGLRRLKNMDTLERLGRGISYRGLCESERGGRITDKVFIQYAQDTDMMAQACKAL
jgi:hypothetical protein